MVTAKETEESEKYHWLYLHEYLELSVINDMAGRSETMKEVKKALNR
jgi:hypothetical protein